MHIRTLAIAAALPLLAATACKTSSSHKGTSSQAQTSSTGQKTPSAQAQVTTGAQTPSQSDPATSAATPLSSGQGSEQGVRAHSDDQVVRGKLTKVSTKSLEIQSAQGEAKTLQLVPETSVKVDGQDAKQGDLKEGQDVRASFNQVDGKDVAVQVQAGKGMGSSSSSSSSEWVDEPAHQGDSMHQGTGSHGSDTGSPASGPSSGSDHTNSPNGPASPNTANPGRNY